MIRSLKIKIKIYFYLRLTYSFSDELLFFMQISISDLHHFISLKMYFRISFNADVLGKNSAQILLDNVFYFTFSQDSFIEFLFDDFCSQRFKLFYFLLICMVSEEKLYIILLFSLLQIRCYSSLASFETFSLFLTLYSLKFCLGVVSFFLCFWAFVFFFCTYLN